MPRKRGRTEWNRENAFVRKQGCEDRGKDREGREKGEGIEALKCSTITFLQRTTQSKPIPLAPFRRRNGADTLVTLFFVRQGVSGLDGTEKAKGGRGRWGGEKASYAHALRMLCTEHLLNMYGPCVGHGHALATHGPHIGDCSW